LIESLLPGSNFLSDILDLSILHQELKVSVLFLPGKQIFVRLLLLLEVGLFLLLEVVEGVKSLELLACLADLESQSFEVSTNQGLGLVALSV
jgi:hypothetical protein